MEPRPRIAPPNIISLWLIALSFASTPGHAESDPIDQLTTDASLFARQHNSKASIKAMQDAMDIAAKRKKPELIDFLHLQYTLLLYQNGIYPQFLTEAKVVLSQKDALIQDLSKDPDIGIQLDDLLTSLIEYGVKEKSTESYNLAQRLVESFSQFGPDRRTKVICMKFDNLARQGEWAQGEKLTREVLPSIKVDRSFVIARLHYACMKQHKKQEAQRAFTMLSKSCTSAPPETFAWYYRMGQWLFDANDLESSEPFLNKACSTAGDINKIKGGSYAIAVAYNLRAHLKYKQNKLAEAEADARTAVAAAVGPGQSEQRISLELLERVLLREHKFDEAKKARSRIHSQFEFLTQ
jgi:hypothetical protein